MLRQQKLLASVRLVVRDMWRGRPSRPAPTAITLKRAAMELGVSEASVEALLSAGLLVPCRVGGHKMLPRCEVAHAAALLYASKKR